RVCGSGVDSGRPDHGRPLRYRQPAILRLLEYTDQRPARLVTPADCVATFGVEMAKRVTCDACDAKRRHTPAEWRQYHPDAGHGYTEGQGWSHPDLEAADGRKSRLLGVGPPNLSA